MDAPKSSIVLMHTSLRLVGEIEGGAEALLDAMLEYFTEEGGLFCVPTHTWHNLGGDITLDMNDTKTCLGAFSDLAAADKRGVRSENPSHSMTVFGDRERVLDFIKDEPYVTSWTSPEGCYGKIYREGGYILLVGVAHSKNTYLHCVDEMLGVPNRLTEETYSLAVKLTSGDIVKRQMKAFNTDYTSDISLRFPKYETAFRYHGAIRDGFIGNAPAQLCDARIMKETVELIMERSSGNDPLKGEEPILPKLYC